MEIKKWTKEYEKNWQKEYRLKHKDKIKEYNKNWRLKNPERNNELGRIERDRLKLDVLNNYSNGDIKCTHCRFNDIRALQLDHIYNNGAEERREQFGDRTCAGTNFYRWIRKQNYPEGYQVLCANCNIIKLREHEKTLWK
jgi:hypothetical protein